METLLSLFTAFLLCASLGAQPDKISPKSHEVLSYVAHHLPENPVILECGGCNGDDTLRMARLWPKGKIYTFEPVPHLFDLLTERVRSCGNVTAFSLALADSAGKKAFYVSHHPYACVDSGSSSLLPPKEHLVYDDLVTFNQLIEVDAVTLDEWAKKEKVEHVDFMWLDMQGYELHMLKASEFAKTVDLIYTEVEFVEAYQGQYLYADMKKWMEDHGFELLALDFDEAIALKGKEAIKPNGKHLYYGNVLYRKKRTSA